MTRMNSASRAGMRAWGALTAGVYLLIYLPILTVAAYSFNTSRFGAGWRGFTTGWYSALATNKAIFAAASNSVFVASISTVISVVLGTLLGVGLARGRFRGKRLLEAVIDVPVVVSDLVIAVALVTFYAWMRSATGYPELGFATIILSHVTFQIPFVALVVRARAVGLDPRVEEAARDLGASPVQVALRVTVPLLLPGIISAALLAFTLSLDDFVVTFFTSGPGSTTMPVLIYSSVKRGITPDINAASTVLVCISLVLTLLSLAVQRRVPR